MGLCISSWPRLSLGPQAACSCPPWTLSGFTRSCVTPIPLPSCHLSWGFLVVDEACETPRDTLGPPKGNPDVPRINTPQGQGPRGA